MPNHQRIELTATVHTQVAIQVMGTMMWVKKNTTVLAPVLMILSKVIISKQIELPFETEEFFISWIFSVWNDADYEKYASAEATKADKQYTFAEKLRDALRHSDTCFTDSTDDSYAVDISISGSRTDADEGIRYVHSLDVCTVFVLKLKVCFF